MAQHSLRNCPEFGKTCLKCNKSNHFAKCCFSKTGNLSLNLENNRSVSQLSYLNKSNDENYYINVSVEEKNVRFQIDTGSDITLLCKRDSLKLIEGKREIEPFQGRVQAYDGSPVHIIGKINASVKIEQKEFHNFPIHLTENNGASLCGIDMTKLLGIKLVSQYTCLKIESETNERQNANSSLASSCTSNFEAEKVHVLENSELDKRILSEAIERHHDLFVGVGKIKNYDAKFIVNENAPVSFQKSREVPLALEKAYSLRGGRPGAESRPRNLSVGKEPGPG